MGSSGNAEYMGNAWESSRRSNKGSSRSEAERNFDAKENSGDRARWEEEQKNMDRAWYDLDAGYDEVRNPFANVSEDYVKQKEEQLKKQTKKRKSERARQTQKDNDMWE